MASVFDPVASAMPTNALVVVDDRTSQDAVGESASGARGSRSRRGSITRVGALWSMFQVYVLLLIVVIAYNALANALRPVRLDLSPEGMMLAGGVDPSVVARYNASNYASARYEMQHRHVQTTYWTHMTRLTIRSTANAIAAVGVGSIKISAALGRASVGLVATALESAGLGVVVDFSRAMGDGAISTVQNVAWLMAFAVAPVVDYALEPLYDFVYDGVEPLYQTFVAGTMDFFEDTTFALEQNLASVVNARVMNIIRWPLHIVLNPFKWPMGVFEAIIHPTYKFCAYPEYFDDVPEPQLPIVRSTFGDKCRSNVWGEWTECSMKCGPGFKVRANHCGKKQVSRCAGTDMIGCDGKCGSGLRTDCNGICGGKTLVDKCGVCGGMNAALGCDGKCFSGMREDTFGSCCHASTISAGGTCGSDAALPDHLKNVASQARKDPGSENSFERMVATLKSVALFFLRILSIVARVVGHVVNTVFSLAVSVLSTIFSTAMLKVIGSLTAGYMVVGVVDKKAQQNLGKFFRDAVPFLDEKERETKNYVVAAMEKKDAPAKPKDQVESFVRRILDDIKRAKDVPGSIMNYVLWLYAKAYGAIVYLSPLILDFLRDSASVHLHEAKREAEHAKAEAQQAKREKDVLLERVQAETLAVEERRKLLTETRQAMEKARAVEIESRRRQKEAEREAKRVQEEAVAELQRAKEMAEIEARKASELHRRDTESLQLQARLLEEKARADRARIEEEERITRDAREQEEMRMQSVRADEARFKSRLADQEGKVHEAVAAASQILRRVEADEARSKSLRRDVVEFEKANIANAKAAKNQAAAERAKEYCSFVTTQFSMMDAFILAQQIVDREQDALDMVKLRDEYVDIKARLMHFRPVPPSLKQTYAFLRKYDARRRSVVALVNAAFFHPEERVQVKALEALARLAAKPSIAARILSTTSTIKEALRAFESKTTGSTRAILAMELVHAMVTNREFAQMGVAFDAESSVVLARALASVLKTTPVANSTPDDIDIRFLVAGIDVIWHIVRYSNYDDRIQTSLAEEGVLRYLLTLRPIASKSTELARVLCGLAMALALENTTVQAMMTEPGVKFPRRVIKLLAQHDAIDYHGEFAQLNDFLTANAGK